MSSWNLDAARTIDAIRVIWETSEVRDERYGQRAAARRGFNWFAMSPAQRDRMCTAFTKHTAEFATLAAAFAHRDEVRGTVQVRYAGNSNFAPIHKPEGL